MGLLDRFKALTGGKGRKGTGLEVARWRSAPPRRGSADLVQAYKEMPWLGTIVDVVSDAVASNGWRVVRRMDANKRPMKDYSLRSLPFQTRRLRMKALESVGEVEEVPDHPLLKLLSDPNDYFTAQQTWGLVQKYLDLLGEAFLVVEKVGSVPVGLWPVPPHAVTRLPDLTLAREDRTYTMQIGGLVRAVPADLVLHLRHLDPDDPLGRGVGRAFALGDELDTDEYIARFTKSSFFNNCTPAFIAAIDGMNDPSKGAAAKFKEELSRNHGGPDNAGKMLVTNGKVSLARLDTSFRDLNLVAVREFLMAFIRMTYRVPPEIVGDITSSNKATAYAARENLAEQCTVPRLEFLRAFFQKWLVPMFGDDAILDYDSPVPADQEFQLRVMGTMASAFSYDEWRGVAGFKPDPERQGYPMPMPGQKPDGDQTPAPDPTGPAGTEAEEDESAKGDPPWASQPLL